MVLLNNKSCTVYDKKKRFIEFSGFGRGKRYTEQKSAKKQFLSLFFSIIPYYALAWSQLLTCRTKNTQVWLGNNPALECNAILYTNS